ncbi:pickpocket protein 28-like [Battus philenor]|uniref:pickpocket protein 28-like n=1 Tax=Battus philenor TaxID=42288 RepID=UPI0035D0A492
MNLEAGRNYLEVWWNGIKSLPETTSIHGFRFIGDRERHWSERVCWLIFVALCWYGSALLISAQYDAFQNYPISFVVETTYKDWDTYFPSVAICENDNTAHIETVSDRQDHRKFDMVSNQTTGPGVLNFNVMVPAKLYISNEEEVPSLTIMGLDAISLELETSYRRTISIRNIENDAGARFISPSKRKCRYVDENFLDVYPYYSYTACTVQCRKNAQLKLCNCTSFYMPSVKDEQKCDVDGLVCLNKHVNELSGLKAKWSTRSGLLCDCLPSCTEADISVVKDFRKITNENYASVQIALEALPSERYRRNVVRGLLDLIVSTGGTGGLFLGASILSFVELLYILLIRPFCDVYSQLQDDPCYRKFGKRRFKYNLNKRNVINVNKKSTLHNKRTKELFKKR